MAYLKDVKGISYFINEMRSREWNINYELFENRELLYEFCKKTIDDNNLKSGESFHKAIGIKDDKYIIMIISNMKEISISLLYLIPLDLYHYKKRLFNLKEIIDFKKLAVEVGESNIIRYEKKNIESDDNNRIIILKDDKIHLAIKIGDDIYDNNKNKIDTYEKIYYLKNIDNAFDEAFESNMIFKSYSSCRLYLNKIQSKISNLKLLPGGKMPDIDPLPPYEFK